MFIKGKGLIMASDKKLANSESTDTKSHMRGIRSTNICDYFLNLLRALLHQRYYAIYYRQAHLSTPCKSYSMVYKLIILLLKNLSLRN